MTALLDRLRGVQRALRDADVASTLEDAIVTIDLHERPGADMKAELMRLGVAASTAQRWARVAVDVLGDPPEDPNHTLRNALGDAVFYLEHPDTVIPANRVRQLRSLAGVALNVSRETSGFARGMEGSALAGAKWTAEEVAQVDAAIAAIVARLLDRQDGIVAVTRSRGYRVTDTAFEQTFTADDVWAELGDGFLVTKGLAGRLTAAANRGIIRNTMKTTTSRREGDHGHAQRLTVWEAARGGEA